MARTPDARGAHRWPTRSACTAGRSSRCTAACPSTSSTSGTRPMVLDVMLEADLTAGSGSTVFLTSAARPPRSAIEAHHLADRAGRTGRVGRCPPRSPSGPRRSASGRARSYGSTEHPSTTGCSPDDARGQAQPDRRSGRWRASRCASSTTTATTSPSANPARSGAAAPTCSPATPTRPLTTAVDRRRLVPHRRHRGARRRGLHHDHRPHEATSSSGAATNISAAEVEEAAPDTCRASPRWRSSPRPTHAWASTRAPSLRLLPRRRACPTSSRCRPISAPAGSPKQKLVEELRLIADGDELPPHPLRQDQEVRATPDPARGLGRIRREA